MDTSPPLPNEDGDVVVRSGIFGVLHNGAFVAAFLGFFFAQIAKVFTHHFITREWDMTRLVGSGGMPSSHTALVMGLTTALGVLQGTNSPFFAISLVFSLIVMYDATGVRLHAGKQASVLNMIITELPPDHPVSSSTGQLKEVLGHTPLQVAVGAVVGIVIGFLDLLAQLTEVGNYDEATFKARFSQLQSLPDMYKTVVIEDLDKQKIIATATLLIELKFIRNCSKCGHIEDVVVDTSYRGLRLGLRVVEALITAAKDAGCYKVILDCSESNAPFYEKCGLIKKEIQMVRYL